MINAAFKLQDSGFSREQVEALTAYWEGSLASKEDIAHLDGKITAEIADLRGELKQDIAHLRAEVKEDIARLEGKIETTAVELRAEMVELRAEVKEDIADLRGEVKELRTELKYIKWIGAVIIVGVLIPLIRDFLL